MHESLPSERGAPRPEATDAPQAIDIPSLAHEDLQVISAIPVPEDTKLPPQVYQHLAFHAAHNRGKLVGKASRETYKYRQGIRDQEDTVQDAFLAAMEQSTRSGVDFQRSSSSLGYLFDALHYQLLGFASRDHTEVLFADSPFWLEDAAQPSEDEVIESIFEGDLQQWFRSISNVLPQQRRKLLTELLNDPGISSEELANTMRVEASHMRSVKCTVFNFVRHRLEERLMKEGYLSRYAPAGTALANVVQPDKPTKLKEIQKLQAAAVNHIRCCKEDGKSETVAVVPPYIGPWSVASKAIRSFVRRGDANHPGEPAAMLLYPHDHLLADFRRYVSPLLGKEGVYVTITSPQEVADSDPSLAIPYAVLFEDGAATLPPTARSIYTTLQAQAGFLVRLRTTATTKGPLPHNASILPDYDQANGPFLAWRPQDSVRYLQEWRFATGEQLTEEQADELARQGQGPTVRRVCRGIGSFIAVQAEAGYAWPDRIGKEV